MKGYNGSGAVPGEGILNDPRHWGIDEDAPDKDQLIEAILEDVGGDIPTLEDWAAAWLETKSYADLHEMVRDIERDNA